MLKMKSVKRGGDSGIICHPMKREYPKHPIVGVGGVVIKGSHVLLIRRGREPLKGEWSLPGGMLELGESLEEGVKREVLEETGLRVRPLAALTPLDRIQKNGDRVKYHYVIIDFVCRSAGGHLKPASDVLDARWVERSDLLRYHLTRKAASIISDAFAWLENQNASRGRKRH